MNPASSPYEVPALSRGLELLQQFNRREPSLSGADLARRLKLPRASVFRMLQTLERTGFVERVGAGHAYRLGVGVLRLGFECLASMELVEHGRALLDTLRDDTGFSAHLVVRDGTEVVFVAKAAGRSSVFSSVQVGARLPVHATALGRVLLGGVGSAELAALYAGRTLDAYSAQTPTSLARLKKLVDADARQGYAVSEGGFEPGISVVAAPVYGRTSSVAAAISLTVQAPHLAPAQVQSLLAAVRGAAARLTQRCGGQAPTPDGAAAPRAVPHPNRLPQAGPGAIRVAA